MPLSARATQRALPHHGPQSCSPARSAPARCPLKVALHSACVLALRLVRCLRVNARTRATVIGMVAIAPVRATFFFVIDTPLSLKHARHGASRGGMMSDNM